jgi:serine phosphatase RsbU (regulator of sigma subunit)
VSHAAVRLPETGQMIIPSAEGAHFDGVYRRGSTESLAGCWCELFRLRDGRVTLSIGDVAGRGLPAAFMMGQLRRAIRLASVLDPEPAGVLRYAHDQLLASADAEMEATAFFGVFDPAASRLTYASAAHPFAVCCAPTGAMEPLRAESVPLGSRRYEARPSRTVTLPAGALLVVYTPGLAGASAAVREESPFVRAVRAVRSQYAPGQAHRLADALAAEQQLTRDVALLTVAIEP